MEMGEHKGAVIEIGAKNPVFLVTDATYDNRLCEAYPNATVVNFE